MLVLVLVLLSFVSWSELTGRGGGLVVLLFLVFADRDEWKC